MEKEKNTGIQITNKPASKEISIVDGGIKIQASSKPISVGFAVNYGKVYLVIDCSGSMKGEKLSEAKLGILGFTRDAFKKDYRVGLIKFSEKAEHLSEPTAEIGVLQNALRNLNAGGATNLTAAIKMAHSKLKDFMGIKVMVIATDGMPESVKTSLEAAEQAKAAGIQILTIGTDDADQEFLQQLASRSELSSKVNSDMFASAITSASLLLTSPKSLKPK